MSFCHVFFTPGPSYCTFILLFWHSPRLLFFLCEHPALPDFSPPSHACCPQGVLDILESQFRCLTVSLPLSLCKLQSWALSHCVALHRHSLPSLCTSVYSTGCQGWPGGQGFCSEAKPKGVLRITFSFLCFPGCFSEQQTPAGEFIS